MIIHETKFASSITDQGIDPDVNILQYLADFGITYDHLII